MNRTTYEKQIRKANHVCLGKQILEILDGLLLGDGYLGTRRDNISAHYSHGDKHLSYLQWLSLVFSKFGLKQSGQIHLMKKIKNKAYKYNTLTYFELGKIREKWYPNNKKAIPKNLIITPTILKFWYISDGNFSVTPLIDSSTFEFEILKKISNQLKEIGIIHTLREFKDRKRIRISIKSQNKFLNYITSDNIETPFDYKYKFMKG